MNVQMALNGSLLFIGQIVVGHILTTDIILLDDVLP